MDEAVAREIRPEQPREVVARTESEVVMDKVSEIASQFFALQATTQESEERIQKEKLALQRQQLEQAYRIRLVVILMAGGAGLIGAAVAFCSGKLDLGIWLISGTFTSIFAYLAGTNNQRKE